MPTNSQTLIEVCVDSVTGALAAERGGADRLELCAELDTGGLTPSLGLIREVRARTRLPLVVLLRPHAGDFQYEADDLAVVRRDIEVAKSEGADGIVFGALDANGAVERATVAEMIALAAPLPVTFHRAFDLTRDPRASLADCVQLGVARVLTSGQARTAAHGAALLRELVTLARGRIEVIAGGGLSAENIAELIRTTRVPTVHFSARVPVASAAREQPGRVALGAHEFTRRDPSESCVRRIVDAVRKS
ncbi:MAG: copper homeostasis protein CutC [Planctomycetota bacterium]